MKAIFLNYQFFQKTNETLEKTILRALRIIFSRVSFVVWKNWGFQFSFQIYWPLVSPVLFNKKCLTDAIKNEEINLMGVFQIINLPRPCFLTTTVSCNQEISIIFGWLLYYVFKTFFWGFDSWWGGAQQNANDAGGTCTRVKSGGSYENLVNVS